MTRRMILLSGRKKTGKGTIFTIAKKLWPEIGEFFFAKPIKDFCINTLGLTHDQMYGSTDQRESLTEYSWANVDPTIRARYGRTQDDYLTAREVIQVIGTDVMRNNFDPNIWARLGAKEVAKSNIDTCFITDLRMENEIKAAIDVSSTQGFKSPLIIRIYRKTGLEDNHITEKALDKFDAVPGQNSIEQGVPEGFVQIPNHRLWIRVQGDNPFKFIIDNNGIIEDTESNMKMLLPLIAGQP